MMTALPVLSLIVMAAIDAPSAVYALTVTPGKTTPVSASVIVPARCPAKSRLNPIPGVAVAAVTTTGVALAQQEQLGGKLLTGNEVTIPAGTTVDHDVYVFAGTVISNPTNLTAAIGTRSQSGVQCMQGQRLSDGERDSLRQGPCTKRAPARARNPND